MRKQPSDFTIEHTDELAPFRDCDVKQLLGRQTERMFLVHGCDIIEPVEVRQRLQVSLMLDQLLGAAMQETNMRVDAPHDFAVKLQHETQDPVRRGMLRPKIDREIAGAASAM